jgi:hypothetical protein
MTADPVTPLFGVIVTVRFDPAPPKTIALSGTKAILDERPVTVSEVGAVSASEIVYGMGPVDAPCWSVTSAIFDTIGGEFPPVTVIIAVSLVVEPRLFEIVTS